MTDETDQLLTDALRNHNVAEAQRIINEIESSQFEAWERGYNFLCYVLRDRQFEIARLLITRGCKLRLANKKTTALHVAILNAPSEIVKLIHQQTWKENNTCNLLDEDEGGNNVFHLFMFRVPVDKECCQILHYLLKNCPITVKSSVSQLCPIHYAAKFGNTQMIQLLLSIDKTQVNHVSQYLKYTPLHFAIEGNHMDAVLLLLQNFATIEADTTNNESAICLAVKFGLKPIIQILLSYYRPNLNFYPLRQEKMLIYSAVMSRDLSILEFLLMQGLNPNHVEEKRKITPLLLAIEQECLDSVKLLVNYGADLTIVKQPSKSDQDGSVLHFAVKNVPIFSFLLEKGAEINVLNSRRQNPLHIATEMENTKLINVIINTSDFMSFFTPDIKGLTPLHIAVIKDNKEIVESFLKIRVPVDLKTESQLTSMHLAAKNASWPMVSLLLKNEAGACTSGSTDLETPLFYAALSGNLEIVQFLHTLCKKGSETWLEGYVALYAAAYNGHEEVVKFLHQEGADPNLRHGNFLSPLHAAAQRGHKKIVRLLLEIGAVINEENQISTPLLAAFSHGHNDVALMLQEGSDVNAKLQHAIFTSNKFESLLTCGYELILEFQEQLKIGYSPIFFAVLSGNVNLVEKLINQGADVNLTTKSGENPLLLAIKIQSIEIVSLLLKSGADVRYKNSRLLFTAISLNNLAIVNLLLENGHSMDYVGNIGNQEGFSLMHLAVKENNIEIVDALLKNKFQLDACTEKDYVLHYAIDRQNDEIIIKLLDSGASLNSICGRGLSPPLHALLSGNIRIFMMLIKRGAVLKERSLLGKNLLHFALDNLLKEDVIKFLIKIGVNVNERNEFLLSLIERIISDQTEHIDFVNSRWSQILINEMSERANSEEILDEPEEDGMSDENEIASDETGSLRGVYDSNEILGQLLKFGMDVNTIIETPRQTILHYTCISSNTEAVRLLILYNPDFNATDNRGHTPFYYAVEHATSAWNTFHQELCSDVYNEDEENMMSPNLHFDDRDDFEIYKQRTTEVKLTKILRNRDAFKKIARLMTQALVKLEAAGHELHMENRQLLESVTVHDYYTLCKNEIEFLKQTKIDDDISLFDILTADEIKLATYAGNETITTFMTETDFSIFPLYGNELQFRFGMGVERRDLALAAGKNLSHILDTPLPDVVQEFIFRQLTLNEIKNMCRINAPFYFVSCNDSDGV